MFNTNSGIRFFSLYYGLLGNYSCKVLMVGGGTGGCCLASKLTRIIKKPQLILLEPSPDHFYQGWFTLCGAGIKRMKDTSKPTAEVLPKNVIWIQDEVTEFLPDKNAVVTCKGDEIEYDILVIAVGLKLCFDKIKGLTDALEHYYNVGSIYSKHYAEKTYHALEKFRGGNLIFTFPHGLIKCAGAPLKICLLMEDILRIKGLRNKANIFYNTPFPKIFAVKHYEGTLVNICKKREINVNVLTKLIEVRPERNEAVFTHVRTNAPFIQRYSILHVTPPMQPPDAITTCKSLVNKFGYVEVDKYTMQHVRYPNIFAFGDCSNTPNAKTAAACAAQAPIVYKNIQSVLSGQKCKARYNGYASCPIVTGVGKCVLAEFDYSFCPLETFPFSQNCESKIMYFMKKEVIPFLYWNVMLKGFWNGPHFIRKLLHLGFSD
ncbi:sulfide:quinone oxidoreductase, mitochondrial-like [Onthophagus taurus]|uniref:sulfide:quinone oxidoreductase, mitochondrial-like n=1 Tax=Onthophagus taurus TaxID=166361 RepID=UPI000C20B4A4|nr:sulfide:quinone oxidoreductase, mitochondrial-like [Onthophagus taurus]